MSESGHGVTRLSRAPPLPVPTPLLHLADRVTKTITALRHEKTYWA